MGVGSRQVPAPTGEPANRDAPTGQTSTRDTGDVKTRHSVVVASDAATVFDFLSDVANETRWRRSIVGSRYLDAAHPAIGVEGQTDVEMGSKALTMSWTVTAFTPGEYVAWTLDGDPWHGGGSYRVRAHTEGAVVEATLEVRLKGAARLFEPVIGLSLRRGLRSDLARLVTVLDGARAS